MELLLCEEEEHAAELAGRITTLNQERQRQEAEIMEDVERIFDRAPGQTKTAGAGAVRRGMAPWCHRDRIFQSIGTFSKPNILLSCDGEQARGSARSCGEFSLFHALSSCSELLTKFGGHNRQRD